MRKFGVFILSALWISTSCAGPYEDADAALKVDNEDAALVALQSVLAKGETRAQYEVGQLLYLFKKQDIEAKKLFELAAAKGHGEAMYYLANIYQNGKSVRQNYVEAYKWYILAVAYASAGKGFDYHQERASKNRDYVATKMTAAQMAEGQRLAKAWKPQGRDQAQIEAAKPKAPSEFIKYECVKTDNSGVKWQVEADAKTKEVSFFTQFPNGPTNVSGPYPAIITADKITWSWKTVSGKYWSQTVRTIDRRTGKGTIEITYPDEPKWEERNIPCKLTS
jgi:Sel1 repeat